MKFSTILLIVSLLGNAWAIWVITTVKVVSAHQYNSSQDSLSLVIVELDNRDSILGQSAQIIDELVQSDSLYNKKNDSLDNVLSVINLQIDILQNKKKRTFINPNTTTNENVDWLYNDFLQRKSDRSN